MLITLYEMGKVSIHLIGKNGFHVKEENERFAGAGLRYQMADWSATHQ